MSTTPNGYLPRTREEIAEYLTDEGNVETLIDLVIKLETVLDDMPYLPLATHYAGVPESTRNGHLTILSRLDRSSAQVAALGLYLRNVHNPKIRKIEDKRNQLISDRNAVRRFLGTAAKQ